MESSGSSGGTSDRSLDAIRILGVLSDTHDRADAAAAGIATLRAAGAEFFIHCGDVGSERILDLLAGIPCVFVWGNNDCDRKSLGRYARELGIRSGDDFAELKIGGKKIAVTHGDNPSLISHATDEANGFDYLFIGHSHVPANQRIGRVRMINPGALHRAATKTVAVIDLKTDSVRHIAVKI
jgi:uncharacterized protein